jgi:Holliday junction resolvase RusA-like endonuclease
MLRTELLEFTVPGKPFGKQRPRIMRTGHAYTPKETINYENLVRMCFMEKYPDHIPTDGIVSLVVHAYFPTAESWSKKKTKQALAGEIVPRKPDWDNIGKIISDALNEIAYKDDAQICDAQVTKRYSQKPRVDVEVYYTVDSEINDDLDIDALPF